LTTFILLEVVLQVL